MIIFRTKKNKRGLIIILFTLFSLNSNAQFRLSNVLEFKGLNRVEIINTYGEPSETNPIFQEPYKDGEYLRFYYHSESLDFLFKNDSLVRIGIFDMNIFERGESYILNYFGIPDQIVPSETKSKQYMKWNNITGISTLECYPKHCIITFFKPK